MIIQYGKRRGTKHMSCETCKDKPDPGTAYEKTMCAKCRLASGVDNPSNHGKTHIDIDTLVQNEGDQEYAVREQVQDDTIGEGGTI